MGILCCGHGVYVSYGGSITGLLWEDCCGHGVYVSTGGSTTGLLWEDYVVVMVSMCLLGALLLDYYGKTVLWSWCLCVYWGLFYWIIMGRLCCDHGVYVSTGGSFTGLLWEDCIVVMVSMCLLGALLLDYYGKTMFWSWCLCFYWGLYYCIIMRRLCCGHGVYVSTGGFYYWIIMGRLCCGHGVYVSYGHSITGLLWEDCCGHGVYVSTGGSTTGLLWEDYVVVMVSMCLLGAILLDYYGKTVLWSWCLCFYWGFFYWIIMGRLCCGHGVYVSNGGSSTGLLCEDCCGHGVYVSTGGSFTGLLWEDYVVVMVSMFLLGALLLYYYGKTVLWSWCLCVYWGLYYWIIMGRLCFGHGVYVSTGDSTTVLLWEDCCGHGVYVSTGGSTTGLLWEDYVVVMVSMCLLGALLLDYYGKTMLWSCCLCVNWGLYYWIIMGRLLWSWCLCVYWGLYYWIIMGRLCCGHGVYVSTGGSFTGLLWEDYVVVIVSMCLLGALLLDYYAKTVVVMVSMFLLGALLLYYYGKTVLWSWCLCVYWGLYYWIIMGRLCFGHGVYVSYGGSITGLLWEDCCGHGVYVSTGVSTTGLLWEDYVVVMVSMCLPGSLLLDYYGKTVLWSWCLCVYWGLFYWIIIGRLCCGDGVYVCTEGSSCGLLWEDYVVVMLSMCLLGALLLDYYGKTVLWSWCLCVYWGLFYWIIMGRLCCGHGVYVSTGGSSTGLLLEDYVVVMLSMCLLGALLLDYYGKTVLWSCCLCVYWGLFYWIIMGRLCCGHGVYVSTGGSSTGLLWEDCVVVMVSMCLLWVLLLDYYGKTVLWSCCLCVYWGLYYWIIMGRLYCGHGVYVSTVGSSTGLLWEDCVVVMVSMCLLWVLLLDYYGKTVLWSCCLCVYWGLYYWIIMGRLCCDHGVYVSTVGSSTGLLWEDCVVVMVFVSTGGSTTGLLWEDYVVVMVSMCLLGALLLDYYGNTMLWSWCLCILWGLYYWIIMGRLLWSWCLCVYWVLYYWIIMGRLCCGHGVYVSTRGSTTGLLWEGYVVVMVSMCLLGALLLDYYGKLCCGHGVHVSTEGSSTGLLWEGYVVVMVSMCLLGALLLDYYGKTMLWSWFLCVYWGLYYWIIMGRLCCGHGVHVSTEGSSTVLLWEDCVVIMVSMCLLGALLLDYYGKTMLWSWCLCVYWGLYNWIIMGRLYCGHGVYVSTGGYTTGLLWEDCIVVMVSMCLLGAILLDYYGKTIVVMLSMCLLGALLLDYYGKTVLWSWCLCVYWGLFYWIIIGRLCCGHVVYVSTGGSSTGLLWEDCIVVMLSLSLLGALLLDYYGKTMLWSWCLCVYWGLYYWIIMGRLCCGHGVYVSTGGYTTVLLWEDYVVVMVSMFLLGALLLDYYGKTVLWSWCLCVYWGLYYCIIMGRLCYGHGVYVSTGGSSTGLLLEDYVVVMVSMCLLGGSTTGLLWEDYVVVMVSMCLLGALLLDYYGKTCGHGVYVSTGDSTTGLLWEDYVVVMVSMYYWA